MAGTFNSGVSRRGFLKTTGGVAGAAALGLSPFGASAQSGWKPTKAIEFVNGTGVGGSNDVLARLAQKIFVEKGMVEQPINVLNKTGAGGGIALDYLTRAEPDGHTIAVGNPTLLSSFITGRARNTYTDVTPIAILQQQYVGYATKSDSRFETAQQLIDELKTDPKSVSIAIGAAVGNQNHISLSLVAKAAGISPRDLKTVIFDSGGASATAALGGHVDIGITSAGAFVQHVEAGNMRLLAIAAPERQPDALAPVPTWTEILGTEIVAGNWYTFFGPAGMGAPQLAFWENAFTELVKQDEWIGRMKERYNAPRFMNSAGTAAFYKAQFEQLKEILTDLGLAA
jgi:putative tricarboxylic transport membrane protein